MALNSSPIELSDSAAMPVHLGAARIRDYLTAPDTFGWRCRGRRRNNYLTVPDIASSRIRIRAANLIRCSRFAPTSAGKT